MHVRAARTNGLSDDEIKEVLLQTAIYCGVPDANTAFRIAQRRARTRIEPSRRRPRRSIVTAAFVYDAVRTRSASSAARWPRSAPTTSAAAVLTRASVDRRPGARPGRRSTRSSSATPTAPARTTATSAGWPRCSPGLPVSVPGTTVNRLCGSSLDAAMIGSRTDRDRRRRRSCSTGGVESMTRAPWVLPKPDRGLPGRRTSTPSSTTLGWRLVNPAMPAGVDGLASARPTSSCRREYGVSRERQDAFAARSHQLADRGLGAPGSTTTSIAAVPGTDLARDESIRAGHAGREAGRAEAGRSAPDGTITAGNASPLSDGASARAARLRGGRRDHRRRAAGPHRRPRRRTRSNRSSSATPRSRRRTAPSRGPASAGARSARSSSTRRSPCSRWPASTPGGSTRRSSTPAAARSPSATRSAPPAAGSSAPWPRCCGERGERWGVAAICIGVGQGLAVVSRTSTEVAGIVHRQASCVPNVPDAADEAVAGDQGRRDRADRRFRHRRPADRADRRAASAAAPRT